MNGLLAVLFWYCIGMVMAMHTPPNQTPNPSPPTTPTSHLDSFFTLSSPPRLRRRVAPPPLTLVTPDACQPNWMYRGFVLTGCIHDPNRFPIIQGQRRPLPWCQLPSGQMAYCSTSGHNAAIASKRPTHEKCDNVTPFQGLDVYGCVRESSQGESFCRTTRSRMAPCRQFAFQKSLDPSECAKFYKIPNTRIKVHGCTNHDHDAPYCLARDGSRHYCSMQEMLNATPLLTARLEECNASSHVMNGIQARVWGCVKRRRECLCQTAVNLQWKPVSFEQSVRQEEPRFNFNRANRLPLNRRLFVEESQNNDADLEDSISIISTPSPVESHSSTPEPFSSVDILVPWILLIDRENPMASFQNLFREEFVDSKLRYVHGHALGEPFSVEFLGESGLDYGGLMRECFQLLANAVENELVLNAVGKLDVTPQLTQSKARFLGQCLAFSVIYDHALGLSLSKRICVALVEESYPKQNYAISDLEDEQLKRHLEWILSLDDENALQQLALDDYFDGMKLDLNNRKGLIEKFIYRECFQSVETALLSLRDGYTSMMDCVFHGIPIQIIDKYLSLYNGDKPAVMHRKLLGHVSTRFNADWLKSEIRVLFYQDGENLLAPDEYIANDTTLQHFFKIIARFNEEQCIHFYQLCTGMKVPLTESPSLSLVRHASPFAQWHFHTCFHTFDVPTIEDGQVMLEALQVIMKLPIQFDSR